MIFGFVLCARHRGNNKGGERGGPCPHKPHLLVQEHNCWKNPCAGWGPALSQDIVGQPGPERSTVKLRQILIPWSDREL